MTARTALVHCADAATAGVVVQRLTADDLRVTVVPDPDPDRAVADAIGDSGTPDALVCAVGQPAPFLGSDPARWYADVLACLTPAFRLVRAAAPALRRSGAGRLVFLGSGWTAVDCPRSTAAAAVSYPCDVAAGSVVGQLPTLGRGTQLRP